jgi:VanZ family protein
MTVLKEASPSTLRQAWLLLWRFRWLIWSAYAMAWTLALLTPQPIRVAQATFGPETGHLASKGLHISAYTLFTVLSAWLRARLPWRWLLPAFVSAHAFLTEYLQQFVPERTPSLGDVGLDHLGIALGMILAWKWWLESSTE